MIKADTLNIIDKGNKQIAIEYNQSRLDTVAVYIASSVSKTGETGEITLIPNLNYRSLELSVDLVNLRVNGTSCSDVDEALTAINAFAGSFKTSAGTVNSGDTITDITSIVSGNDVILSVKTDKNPTGFETILTDALKDIVGDLESSVLVGSNLVLTMSTGTVKTVDLSSKFVIKEDGKGLSTNDFTVSYKSKVDASASPIIQKDLTAVSTPIGTSETVVSALTYTVTESGFYHGNIVMNFQKPTGSGSTTRTISLRVKVDGVVADNGLRKLQIVNDGDIRTADMNFFGQLTAGQILTVTVQCSSTDCTLVSNIPSGYKAARLIIKRLY